ncbi:YkvA family protein [Algoriphagus namhaensis]
MPTFKSKSTEILDKAKSLFGKQAEIIAQQPKKLNALLGKVGRKIGKLTQDPRVQQLLGPIAVFVRMIRAHFKGLYKISTGTLGFIVLGLIYFVSPIDIIPDFLGALGFADDVSVILAIYAKIKDEVEDFLDWERTSK